MAKPGTSLRSQVAGTLQRSLTLVLSILVSVLFGSLLMLWYKQNPITVYGLLLKGAVGSPRSIAISLQRATPLIFTAIGSMVAFRTGMFNVGVEGQFLIGAIFGTYVGYALKLPRIVHLPLCLLVGFVAGAAWALVPAVLRQWYGINEIITTIMANYIATYFVSYLTNYPMRETPITAQTPPVQPTAWLTRFTEIFGPKGFGQGSQAHVGILIALALVIIVYVVFKRSKIGYEWRILGLSAPFSEFGGINLNRTFILGMLVSGGIAGLGGAVEILGVWRVYKDLFASGWGLRGNLAALLGGQTVIGSAIAAVFYGAMEAGAMGLDWSAGIPRQLIDIVVGLVIFFMAADGMWDFVKRIRIGRAAAAERRTTQDLQV
jgi:general nucleoside transport system permease protein